MRADTSTASDSSRDGDGRAEDEVGIRRAGPQARIFRVSRREGPPSLSPALFKLCELFRQLSLARI